MTPTSISFGNVVVRGSNTLPVVLTSSGTDSVTISQVTAGGRQFNVGGLSVPVTLASGQQVGFAITFTPAASGTFDGYITIVSNATNSPTNEPLTGNGIHVADLAWNASTSAVAGYNVYRGSASGGPYTRLNASLIVGTAYRDASVQAGQAYYYVATAVDSNYNESPYSNESSAIVPSP